MNYMEKQYEKAKRELAVAVGDFIYYWGFRKIHGQIWLQIFLAEKPLSGSELAKRLKVSKALVSPALKELIAHQLITVSKSKQDSREKLYRANSDFIEVIKNVLQKRELPMLERVQKKYEKLTSLQNALEHTQNEQMKQLGDMISQAQLCLNVLLQINNFTDLGLLLQVGYGEIKT